jgi:hypothetical protein
VVLTPGINLIEARAIDHAGNFSNTVSINVTFTSGDTTDLCASAPPPDQILIPSRDGHRLGPQPTLVFPPYCSGTPFVWRRVFVAESVSMSPLRFQQEYDTPVTAVEVTELSGNRSYWVQFMDLDVNGDLIQSDIRRFVTAQPTGPTGACCFHLTECGIFTVGDCLSIDGIYVGNGSECTSQACLDSP